jgi:hypothetical protein
MSIISSWDMGGPWIEPKHAVMALYATEANLTGGTRVDVSLPFPTPERAAPLGPDGRPAFWTDVAVLALRAPQRLPAHEFVLRLDPPEEHTLTEVVLDQGKPNAAPALAATMTPVREFALAVSGVGSSDADFTEVLRGTLAAEPGPQRFALPAGTKARHVRLRLLSGHDATRPRWTLGEFEVRDAAGRNLAGNHTVNRLYDGALTVRAPMPLAYNDWKAANLNNGRADGPAGVFCTYGRRRSPSPTRATSSTSPRTSIARAASAGMPRPARGRSCATSAWSRASGSRSPARPPTASPAIISTRRRRACT